MYEQILPIRENPYGLKIPIPMTSMVDGNSADGALPNAAIPAGRPRTPAPTIDLTKLKISFGIEAP